MEVVSRRRGKVSRNGGVVSGSVWENRMKLDEFKVYSNSEEKETPQVENQEKMGPKPDLGVGVIMRKTWKSEGNPIQISRKRSELCKNLSVSVEGMKKSSVQTKNSKKNNFEDNKNCEDFGECEDNVITSNVKSEGKPIQISRKRSELCKNLEKQSEDLSVSVEGMKKSSVQTKNSKKPNFEENKNCKDFGECEDNVITSNVKSEGNPIQISSKRSELCKNLEKQSKDLSVSVEGMKKSSVQTKNSKNSSFEENKNVVAVDECEDKVITSNLKSESKSELNLDNEEDWDVVSEEDIDEEIEKQSFKEISVSNERSVQISPIIKKQPQSPTRTKSDEFQRIPRQHSNLQSFVDLVMWRNVSKSALIFGFGTFFIISSSYTQDLNISLLSVISYMCLVYLAAIFLFRSLIQRGTNDIDESSSESVVGEEEAVCVLKFILPYINECLLKIRALFSGDPATTMKMAVVLFILARCGSSITIWKMSKLGFFGVFIVPKVSSSYSTQLTAYGTFWIRRFRDAWESCTHKKAIAFAIFTLVWNLSSIAARIWTVFMLYVGFRYYQQKMMREEWVNEETATKAEDYWQQKIGRRSTFMEKENTLRGKKKVQLIVEK